MRRLRQPLWILGGLLVLAGLAAWLVVPQSGIRPEARPEPIDRPAVGGLPADPSADRPPAPDFEIVLYQGGRALGGETVRLAALWQRGRPVVLNFWAGLCPPCRVEMPDFQKLHDTAGGRFTLIGVDIGPFIGLGTREEGVALLQELRITFPAGTARDAGTVAAYRILGMPTTVFITPQGTIFKKHAGLLTHDWMASYVAELLKASEAQ